MRMLLLACLLAVVAVRPEPEVNYDEYPVVVPKRSMLILDKLIALQRALVDNGDSRDVRPERSRTPPLSAERLMAPFARTSNEADGPEKMELQRRGHGADTEISRRRVWRCYFNDVNCLRR